MAKQETFTAKLVCPNCRTTGLATCEENENPMHPGKLDRSIQSVSEGFRTGGYLDGNQQVVCSRGRVLVPI
jgi:uncharacterized protein YbaR (Trm112 family)